jgi:hypothetical protein
MKTLQVATTSFGLWFVQWNHIAPVFHIKTNVDNRNDKKKINEVETQLSPAEILRW